MAKVYSNFVHVLKPGERPEEAAPLFRTYSGMDLEYWQEFYLLGEAEEVAERIRGKIEALGGVDHLILNPLDWDPAHLETLAYDVPAARDGVGGDRDAAATCGRSSLDEALGPLADRIAARRGRRDRRVPGARRAADRATGARRHARWPACAAIARDEAGGWRIGALTTWTDVAEAPTLPAAFDGLRAAARPIGGRQIQNAGTIAGNLVNASPAADGTPNLLALDAVVELASAARGVRRLPVGDFVTGNRSTVLAPDELVTAVLVPDAPPASPGPTFLKLGSRAYLVISIVVGRGGRRASRAASSRRAGRRRRVLAGAVRLRRARGASSGAGVLETTWRTSCGHGAPAPACRRSTTCAAPAAYRLDAALHAGPARRRRSSSRDGGRRSGSRSTAARRGRDGRSPAPRRRPARGPRPDRHEGRLQRRRLRRVHGAARRRAGLLVPRARRPGRGTARSTTVEGLAAADGTLAAAPGRVPRRRRRPVRRLHARDADGRGRPARATPIRPRPRSSTGSAACSAAAPGTRRSSRRCVGRRRRGGSSASPVRPARASAVGARIARIDGVPKVTGAEAFGDDLPTRRPGTCASSARRTPTPGSARRPRRASRRAPGPRRAS